MSNHSLQFKKAFWEWFDMQPKPFRDKYLYHKEDMAEIYFYNQIYKKDND